MDLSFTPEQEALRQELKEYFDKLMTEELRQELSQEFRHEGGGPLWRETMMQLGRDGWIGIGWPKEYGGQEKTSIEQYIFTESIMSAGFPYPFLTTDSVGPALFEFGSQELRDQVIPEILAGKTNICIGYSEPSSGTDLASLSTRAELDGDHYVINGQKIFTSLAEFADYVWLACRTSDIKTHGKHGSISIFLVPMDTPGIEVTPIYTLGSVRTNATYYDNVRIPQSCLVGKLNQGWNIITSQLNRERLALVAHGPICQYFEEICQWAAKAKTKEGTRIIDIPWVKHNLARLQVGTEAIRLMCYKQAWAMTSGNPDLAEASTAKVYGSEFFVEAYKLMMEILGFPSTFTANSEANVLKGKLERLYRTASILTFGGGTNEIQRDIISIFGLNIPRPIKT